MFCTLSYSIIKKCMFVLSFFMQLWHYWDLFIANILLIYGRVGDRTIGFLLLSAFKSRYKEVLTKAHTAAIAVGSKFWTILTKEEIDCEIYLLNETCFYIHLCGRIFPSHAGRYINLVCLFFSFCSVWDSSIRNGILQEVANGGAQISDSFYSGKEEKINWIIAL